MFELSIAWKYLLPKRRQLSVSIISLISILVISLVIWLILVFFSVSRGLEKGWIEKLTAITAPVRLTPTEAYYNSYYFQIDKASEKSGYASRTLGEKLSADAGDPFDPEVDPALPSYFPKPDLDQEGRLKEIAKLARDAVLGLKGYSGLSLEEFSLAQAQLKVRLLRGLDGTGDATQAHLTQAVFVGAHNVEHPAFRKTLLAQNDLDKKNLSALALLKEPAGEPILVPKGLRDAGVLQGDHGQLLYQAPTVSSLQEQRVPVHVAGFYDPGIVPLGGKFIIASEDLVKTMRAAEQQDASPFSNGFNIRLDNLESVDALKKELAQALDERGILPYWKIETFREYDYAKDLLQQLRSEKHIFSLISLVILTVACSNIISMLIILVNNKRQEIGILRSMGASSVSIASIFGLCGILMGLAGTLLGSILALLTLNNLNSLLGLISRLQGYDAFNPLFYGEQLPNEMSFEVLGTILIATAVLSLVAGLVPALKAAKVKPAEILRAEG